MNQVAVDEVAPFLPQEIIRNILEFLPVKSLIRFQCVCKHWKNLIKTPSFIASHLHHSAQHRSCLLLHDYSIRDRLQLCFLNCEKQIVEVQNIPVVDGWFWMVGSSNGLLCLGVERYGNGTSPSSSLLLWNPAFREVRDVPTTFPGLVGFCYTGFGFSPIVNDYKIVKLIGSKYDYQTHVEVYSLGMGSWKKIEVGNFFRGLCMGGEGFTLNGAIFWVGFKHGMGKDGEHVVVSFDIAMEVFALIPAPAVDLAFTYSVHVTEFEHRLALLFSTLIGNPKHCLIELWVLEEGTSGSDERWSWAKKYTSSPHSCMLNPMTIWRNEIACKFQLLDGGSSSGKHVERTVLSNFNNTELEVLFDHDNYIFNYVESLVPVSNIHVEESTLKSLNLYLNDVLKL